MSSLRSVDRSAVVHEVDRSAVARGNVRALLCRFTLADDRRCRAAPMVALAAVRFT